MKRIITIFQKIFSTVIDCIMPTIPIMVGVGMLKVFLIIVSSVLNILPEDSNTYTMLSLVADSGYYFLPIYVAVSSAEIFKTNKYIAAVCGGMLVAPKFVSLVESGINLSVFGLPVANQDYGNQIIASILVVWILSYVEKLLNKIPNESIKAILNPVLAITIMVPISFCAIGPIGVFLGNGLVSLILALKNIGPFGNGILCAILPIVTILGLGGANVSAMLLLSASGCDEILFFSNVLYNNILGFVTFALYLKDKKPNTLAASISSALAGASEPALFGIVMKDFKAMIALIVGGFFGGLISGVLKVKSYAMASFGILGVVTTIGPESSIVYAFISLVVGCVVGFCISFLTHKKIS